MCLGVPGRVESIWEQDNTRMATVDFGGVRKDVCLAYVPDVVVGDYTIVHVGFALTKLDEKSALQALKLLEKLEDIDDVQNVYTNADIPDAVVESYQTS